MDVSPPSELESLDREALLDPVEPSLLAWHRNTSES
jgi:hypothetical protein